jgi:hypothetical protein
VGDSEGFPDVRHELEKKVTLTLTRLPACPSQNLTLCEVEVLWQEDGEERWSVDPMESSAFPNLLELRVLRSVSAVTASISIYEKVEKTNLWISFF